MFDRWRTSRIAAFALVIVAAIFALVAGGLPAHAADPTPEASSVTAEPAPTQSSNDPVPPAPPQPTKQSPTTAPGPAPVPTPSKPNPPRSVTAVGGDGDALVRWDTSEGANAGPVIYIAKAVPGDRTCETNQTSCLITGLTNGTEYEFSVRAKGEGGESSATNAANRVAAGTDPPSEPTGVSAVGGDGKLDISWTKPSSDGSATIDGYSATVAGAGTCSTKKVYLDPPSKKCSVSGLTNGKTYSVTVTASNSKGTSKPSSAAEGSPAGKPSAPTNAKATAGSGEATVTWSAPADNGSSITAYNVYSKKGKGSCSTKGETTCAVTGLTNGTAYQFDVEAVNAIGTGPESAYSDPVTPTGPPAAPTGVSATAGDQQATVAWKPAADDGGIAVNSYTVTSNAGQTCFANSAVNNCVVSGLTNGTTYTFTVVASNSAGVSPASDPTQGVTPGSTTPGEPTDVTLKASNRQVAVSWKSPGSAGNGVIKSYTATASTGQFCTKESKLPYVAAGTSCTITDLPNGTAVTVTVTATNSSGTGQPSQSAGPVTPSGKPDTPGAVTGSGQESAIAVNWDAAADNGSPITGYKATATAGKSSQSCTGAGDASDCTITGLVNDAKYTVTVVATNANGDSDAGKADSTVTPFGKPSAPKSVSGKTADKQITVQWVPGADNGSPITGYTVTSQPDSAGCTADGTGKSCVVDGLTNGTGYTFTVVAANAAGSGPGAESKQLTPGKYIPGAPLNVTAVPTDAAAKVSWETPATTGAGVESYKVQVVNGQDNGSGSCQATGLQRSCSVTGLTNGTAYSFVVTANNVYGASPDSDASAAVIPAGAPTPATEVVGQPGDQSIEASWAAPSSDGGAPITAYQATATEQKNLPPRKSFTCESTGADGNAPATNCRIGGLTNAQAYTIVVKTTNKSGKTSISSSSAAVTPAGQPSPPLSLTGSTSSGEVTLKWKSPKSNGGSAITDYVVTSEPGGATCGNGTALTCTIGGLTNKEEYSFTAVAKSALGTSEASNTVTATPGKLVPDPPTDVVAKVIATDAGKDGKIKVSWKGSDAGNPIKYQAVASPGDLSCTSVAVANTCTIDGLSAGTSYYVTVKAYNIYGWSSDSAPSSPVVPGSVPEAPQNVKATAGDKAIAVVWDAPGDPGTLPVTGYTATATTGTVKKVKSTCDAAGDATGCDISDLADGKSYTVSVVAKNAIGTSKAADAQGKVDPIGPPSPPTGASATAGNGDATITWKAPAETGGASISKYIVTGNDGKTCSPATMLTKSCKIKGLTGGEEYTFTVQAINKIGASQPSESTEPVTPGNTTPGSPTDVVGTPTGNGKVTVKWSPPTTSGSTPILQYRVTSSPGAKTCAPVVASSRSCAITGLTNGTSYTFAVSAKNLSGWGPDGTSEAVVPVGLPTAPQSAKAVAGDGSIAVSWAAPTDDGGSPITKYTATARSGLAKTVAGTCVATGDSATDCTIPGLKDGTAYQVAVVADNAVGAGATAKIAGSVTPGGAPAAPTAVTASASDSSATVSWKAPTSDGGSKITAYAVNAIPAGDSAPAAGAKPCNVAANGVGALATSCLVTGLTNGTAYSFTVSATNALGTSVPSDPSAPITPGKQTPGAPTSVSGASGNAAIEVSWSAPTQQGGASINKYVATAAPGGKTCATDGTTSSCSVGGLTNGKAYTFTVVASNKFGSSPASAASKPTTPGSAPTPPLPVSALVSAGNSQITAYWLASSSDGGSPVQSYRATASPGGQACTVATASSSAMPPLTCVIKGLRNGVNYTFSVQATNAIGTSAPGQASKPFMPYGPPTAPRSLSGKATWAGKNLKVTIKWAPPASNGGSPINRYLANGVSAFKPCVATAPATTCSYVFKPSALAPKLASKYTFEVAAQNALYVGPNSPILTVKTPPPPKKKSKKKR